MLGSPDPLPGFEINDSMFLRYLRARNFHVEKSFELLSSTISWRKEFGLNGMFSGAWQDVLQMENSTGKMYVRGFDKLGHALIYMRPGRENTHHHDGNLKHLVFNIGNRDVFDYHLNDR